MQPIYKADLVDRCTASNYSAPCSNQKEKEAKIHKRSSGKEKEELNSSPIAEPKTYSETVKKYYVMFDDTDLVSKII